MTTELADACTSTTHNRPGSRSAQARELILDILEGEGEQGSDALDARIAKETGLAVQTAKNVRKKLHSEGLTKARKELAGGWFVYRSAEPRTSSGPVPLRAVRPLARDHRPYGMNYHLDLHVSCRGDLFVEIWRG